MKLSLPPFDQARVLVVGDLMLDRYWHGGTDRISPEAPVPVVHVREIEQRPGGAGNVALNLAALGGHADLVGVTGADGAASDLAGLLEDAGVACHFRRQPGAATITKLRVISRHQQLIRLDFEDGFPGVCAADLLVQAEPLLAGAGAVVLSDYAKGALRNPQPLIQAARAAGKPVLVDPKGRDFSVYRGATLVTPNLAELEGVAGPCPDEAALECAATGILEASDIEALLVTRGAAGMTLYRPDWPPLHQPARAREVFDVTGAGDTVIATLAAALAAGAALEDAMQLANLAAGIVVSKLGTATLSRAELQHALYAPEGRGRGVLAPGELPQVLWHARAAGERIVMTNGCFDILHAGHVAYLAQARSLGDRLLVAVNDDASVHRLKGAGRPANPLDQRMAVLAALGAVDWVVPFAGDTPAELIAEVLPDVLVKGGDYRPETIAGYDVVTANGGRVEVLEFLDGCSTSAIMERIRTIRGDG